MTTASLHREMVEALRREMVEALRRVPCSRGCCYCPTEYEYEHAANCPASRARAALEGWERRERLSSDARVVTTLYEEMNVRGLDASRDEARAILDALEPLLFGAGPRAGGDG